MSQEMEVLCCGDTETLCRPCEDCGQYTGRFRDHCPASTRIPNEKWEGNQHTPLCSTCDNRYWACHYCCGIYMARPFSWGHRAQEPR